MVAMPGSGLDLRRLGSPGSRNCTAFSSTAAPGPSPRPCVTTSYGGSTDTSDRGRWRGFLPGRRQGRLPQCCLVLPLRTDRQAAGAGGLATGRAGHVSAAPRTTWALLVAAQGGAADAQCRAVPGLSGGWSDNLHAGLESRAIIEQPRGVLHAELGVLPRRRLRLAAAAIPRTPTSGSGRISAAAGRGTHSSGGAPARQPAAPGAVPGAAQASRPGNTAERPGAP